MFALINKKVIMKRLFFGVCFLAILSASVFFIQKSIKFSVNAATDDGATVKVKTDDDEIIQYDNHGTRDYKVESDGKTYQAFCANPFKERPGDVEGTNYIADKITQTTDMYNQLKLVAYFYIANTAETQAVMNSFFSDIADDNTRYALIHATLGYIYANDLHGLYENNIQRVQNIRNVAQEFIASNNIVWQRAQDYQLYMLNPASVPDDVQNVIWLEYNPIGQIKITGCDTEIDGCTTLGNGDFANTTFTVYNADTTDVVYGGNHIAPGAKVTSGPMNESCELVFDKLPVGTYIVKQTTVGNGYLINETEKTVTIPPNSTVPATVKFCDQIKRGDVKFTKREEDSGEPMANIVFRITSKKTGENHLVVTNNNGVVNTQNSFIRHSNHTNEYDPMEVEAITYQGFGTWFGKYNGSMTTVNDNLGALPYDTYDIVELACEANQYCYDVPSHKKTFEIKEDQQVVNLGDWTNDCAEFSLDTTATDDVDDDKFVENLKEAKIKDTIDYCVQRDKDFTLKGILMDKETGEPLEIDGETVEKTMTINSETECGQVEMIFEFDATDLAGKEIVVFESLYDGDVLLVEHADIDDDNQFVNIVSFETYATDKADGDKNVIANKDATVTDNIKYCLRAGYKYTIVSTLYDKVTEDFVVRGYDGEPLLVTTEIEPEENCGEIDVEYKFDATNLSGHDIVMMAAVLYNDEYILTHDDVDNEDQTVSIFTPETPDTGFITGRAQGGEQDNPIIIPAIVSAVVVLGFVGIRITRKRSILR
ncbi:VaFE repeat-containing surface-anchored protein [Candidatus Saccharibacteria bacterium]|nr:VaFE repeat-containing surface-anchored protein [Candidatus Saccharibacteria bacterium]